MTSNPRLARTFAVVALLSGVAAAWLVSDYTGSVERRAGRPVRALVAARAIARGETVSNEMLAERSVPQAYVPADAVAGLDSLEGARAATDIGSGAYLTMPLLITGSAAGAGYKLRHNERALTVDAKVSRLARKYRPAQSSTSLQADSVARRRRCSFYQARKC